MVDARKKEWNVGDRVTVALPDDYRQDWRDALNGVTGEVILVRGPDTLVMFDWPVEKPLGSHDGPWEEFWFDASEVV